MKKLLSTLALSGLMLSGAAYAEEVKGWGVSAGTKVSTAGETKILGIQNVSEIVGDGGTEVFIEPYYRFGFAQVGARYSNLSALDEHKLEMTWKLHLSENSTSDLKYFINGGFGFGTQAGQTKTISTNITKPEYVTQNDLSPYKVSSVATIDDSTYVSFSIGFGANYQFTDALKGSLGYEYERKSWDISYTVAGKETTPNDLSGISQNFHGIRFALEYQF